MASLFLIRHAESVANTQGIYQGQSFDTSLSFLGMKQAEALAKRLKRLGINRVLTSPLKRAMETAQIIASKCRVALIIDQNLIETNHGLWEGKKKKWVMKHYPEIFNLWQQTPSKTVFPQGEPFLNVVKRVRIGFERAKKLTGKTAIVTHDNVLRIILSEVLSFPLDKIWAITLDQAALSVVTLGKKGKKFKLICLNDSNHLSKLKSDVAKQAL